MKPFLAQVKGRLLPGTLNKALVGKFCVCLIIALEHRESPLEGNQLLYQYPGLHKSIASFQWLFPRKPEFPFSSFQHVIAFAYNRYLPPLCQVRKKRTSQEDIEEKKALVQVQYRKQQGRKLEEKTSPEKRRGDESLRDSEMYGEGEGWKCTDSTANCTGGLTWGIALLCSLCIYLYERNLNRLKSSAAEVIWANPYSPLNS